MTWKLDKPLFTLSDDAQNEKAKKVWESESLGGLTEDNNRLPLPIVYLLILTILTAFAVTFPLWGQRPNAAIYAGYVKSMRLPEVAALTDDAAAMAKIVELNKGGQYDALLARHPISMDDLRIVAPQIEALATSGADLEEYNVIGDKVVLANFEGNWRANGTRIRKQPWWDKGYVIDIFFITFFFLGVIITVKRLPPSTWQPDHNAHH
jgi:hypothetical protein